MTLLHKLKTKRDMAQIEFERLSHIGGEDFYAAGGAYRVANQDYMEERRQQIGTPPAPLATYNGMPPLSGPHEHTHKQFPPIVSCHEFERGRARTAMIYLSWFACAIATVVVTVTVVAALLYAAGA
tara:strand:- start:421 stop:798 length:378 start_codon:yes stop_codon:yes gene_type:complete